jgi:acetyl esterase/lipase
MFEFMFQIVDVLKSKGKNAACLFLSYGTPTSFQNSRFHFYCFKLISSPDLAPGAPYPRQLQQASALLLHVLHNLKIAPSNIILTGDSAGANLVIALLSHISHPHPSTVLPIPRINLSSPLRGAVLISPWISFDTTSPSFQQNSYKDCIGTEAGRKWSTAFMACPWPHKEASDYYNEAVTAPAEWWAGLKVEEVLVLAGEEEVLIDGIREFSRKLGE